MGGLTIPGVFTREKVNPTARVTPACSCLVKTMKEKRTKRVSARVMGCSKEIRNSKESSTVIIVLKLFNKSKSQSRVFVLWRAQIVVEKI